MKNMKRGMTLIEVMIAVTILATLTILSSQALQRALKDKTKIQNSLEAQATIRDSLRILEKDIVKAFHHRDILDELWTTADKEVIAAPTANNASGGNINSAQPSPQPSGGTALNQQMKSLFKYGRVMHSSSTFFVGLENEIHFTTFNHTRLYSGLAESDLEEVGYFLKDCKNRATQQSSKCLYRRSTPYLDNNIMEGGDAVLLVEEVEEFQLRYLGEGKGESKDDWLKNWRSDQSDHKDQFPAAVEVQLTIKITVEQVSKKLSLKMTTPIHFVNNVKKEKK